MRVDTAHCLLMVAVAAAIFIVIDLLWIGLVARDFYARTIGGMLRSQVNWTAAALFYFLYVGGIVLFVMIPAQREGAALVHAAVMGGLLGLFAYGTFDLTALALFRQWPVKVAVVDMAWGALSTAATATAGLAVVRYLLGPGGTSG